MDPEGMRNGSMTKERSTNTAKITGNRLTQNSRMAPGRASGPRRRASHSLSSSQPSPVTAVRMVRTRLKTTTKLMGLRFRLFFDSLRLALVLDA
jgi:hypothetical protein